MVEKTDNHKILLWKKKEIESMFIRQRDTYLLIQSNYRILSMKKHKNVITNQRKAIIRKMTLTIIQCYINQIGTEFSHMKTKKNDY